jgi:hypothetical protein
MQLSCLSVLEHGKSHQKHFNKIPHMQYLQILVSTFQFQLKLDKCNRQFTRPKHIYISPLLVSYSERDFVSLRYEMRLKKQLMI